MLNHNVLGINIHVYVCFDVKLINSAIIHPN